MISDNINAIAQVLKTNQGAYCPSSAKFIWRSYSKVHRVLVGKPEGKRPLRRPRRNGRIILRWIFRKWEGVVGTAWSWLRIGTGGGHLWVR